MELALRPVACSCGALRTLAKPVSGAGTETSEQETRTRAGHLGTPFESLLHGSYSKEYVASI
jgi:hypothetical protein